MLQALPLLAVGDAGVPLLHDAIRTNDTRLVAAALGPYARAPRRRRVAAGACSSACSWACRWPPCDGLDERADAELAAMLAGLAAERAAAGRDDARRRASPCWTA